MTTKPAKIAKLKLDPKGQLLPADAVAQQLDWPHTLIYLASPYSDHDAETQRLRHRVACYAAGTMIRHGYRVFSPIAHSHKIAEHTHLHGDWETWRDFDLHMLAMCDLLVVLTIPGWKKSRGVECEYEAFVQQERGAVLFWRGPDSPFIAHPQTSIRGGGASTICKSLGWKDVQLLLETT